MALGGNNFRTPANGTITTPGSPESRKSKAATLSVRASGEAIAISAYSISSTGNKCSFSSAIKSEKSSISC